MSTITAGNTVTTAITITGDTTGNLVFATIGGVLYANSSAGGFTLPSGTTAQRPASAANGMLRYNTTLGVVEMYVNGAWVVSNFTSAPVNTVAPAITGTAQINQTLTVSTGTWTNSPTSYAYQWLANSVAITSNATANTFTLTASQVGANITCNVTATNIAGNVTATSNSVGPVQNVVLAQYLVVAGGGGGFSYRGGGAGGFLSNTATLSPGTQYTITVGAGGPAGDSNGASSNITGSGFTTITTVGGGSGNGKNGGSGGGGGGQGTAGQGNNGGSSTSSAGGGGAGAAGTNGDGGNSAGNGGAGSINPITGSTSGQLSGGSYYLAGGGAGGRSNWDGGSGGSGGLGGGGGFTYFTDTGENAPANMGGGGGPAGPNGGHSNSGNGGSGIVILSVPTSAYSNVRTGSNVVVTTSGSNTIITFNSSGTYTA